MADYLIALQANEKDNVATLFAEGVTASARVAVLSPSGERNEVTVNSDIPYGHKLALRPIALGAPIVKYGEQIGVATRAIGLGDYVHVHNLDSTRGRGDLDG